MASTLSPGQRKVAVNLAGLSIIVFALIVSWWLRHGFPDDPAITFRVSRNFAAGQGFLFNPGEKYQASSAPGYALFLGVVALVGGPASIPLVALFLSVAGLSAIGLGLFQMGRWHGQTLAGFVAGLLFVASPFVTPTFFNEILPQAALILWAFALMSRPGVGSGGRWASTALFAIAVLVRPDSMLAAVIGFVWAIITQRRLPWKEALLFLAIVLPFALWSYLYFGFLLPQTMAAKQAQVVGGFAPSFADGALKYFDQVVQRPWFPALYRDGPILIALIIGAAVLPRRWHFWWPVLLWVVAHAGFYTSMKVGFYYWYALPIAIGVSILAGTTTSQVWDWLKNLGIFRSTLLAILALTALYWGYQLALEMFALTVSAPEMGWVFGIAGVLIAFALVRYIAIPLVVGLLKVREAAFLPLQVILVLAFWPYLAWRLLVPEVAMTGQIAEDRKNDGRNVLYKRIGGWFRDNAAAGSSVGYIEIGIIGWEAPNIRIVDPMGLCTPGMHGFVRQKDIWFGAYKATNPDYILVNLVMTKGMETEDKPPGWLAWFQERYEAVALIQTAEQFKVRVYRRRESLSR